MHELTEAWAHLFCPLCWKSCIIVGLCWLATRPSWRGSAALRHLIWTTGAVALLLLPLISIGLGTRHSYDDICQYSFLLSDVQNSVQMSTDANPTSPEIVHISGDEHLEALTVVPSTFENQPKTVAHTLFLIWVAGVIAVIVVFLYGQLCVQRLARRASVPSDPILVDQVDDLTQHLGLAHRVSILCGDNGQVPMTWGILRSVVVLPSASIHWEVGKIKDVLLHEFAHVQRRDTLTQTIAHLACVVFWFNPLVWFLAAHMRQDREQACDDRVLAGGVSPLDYATHLVGVTRELHSWRSMALAGLAISGPRQLTQRVDALLEEQHSRQNPGRRGALLVIAIAAALLLPLAATGQVGFGKLHKTTQIQTLTAVPVTAETRLVNVPGKGPTVIHVIDPKRTLPHLENPKPIDQMIQLIELDPTKEDDVERKTPIPDP